MPAHENLHPKQFSDWWGGSDEAIAHILKKRDEEPPYTDRFGKTWDSNAPVDPSEERQFLL